MRGQEVQQETRLSRGAAQLLCSSNMLIQNPKLTDGKTGFLYHLDKIVIFLYPFNQFT